VTTCAQKKLGVVVLLAYDPFRSGFISLDFDFYTKKFSYSQASDKVCTGSITLIESSYYGFLGAGYRVTLSSIPSGVLFHSVPRQKVGSTTIARSAGVFCQLLDRRFGTCKVRIPSGLVLAVPASLFVTLGAVSNPKQRFVILGKAGRARLKGRRPSVRGIAMNPVDHPHGGRTNGGCPPMTPWGHPTRGQKTAKKN